MTTEAGRRPAWISNVRQMETFGVQVNDEMYAGMRRACDYAALQDVRAASSSSARSSRVIFAGILFGVFTVADGRHGDVQAAVRGRTCTRRRSPPLGQLFTGPLNYFRGSMSSATNLAVVLPMIDEGSFLGRLLGMIDLFLIWWLVVLAIGLGVSVPAPDAADRDRPVRRLRRHRPRGGGVS